LVTWAESIRKTFEDHGCDEVISTRRLVHIAKAYSIFKNRKKAIELCLNRFDTDTKNSFLDFYTKIDVDATPPLFNAAEVAISSSSDVVDNSITLTATHMPTNTVLAQVVCDTLELEHKGEHRAVAEARVRLLEMCEPAFADKVIAKVNVAQ
jgi:hypothetical protein